ncbi:NTP transferase domain-containing protein [uncultured Methanobrevibacter sp.]|uniref:NTP transferase domain-containing protein n=1 Tax=uncultured Methanobrevibacter sp. TaxID=253161 RepID=UPI0025D94916|nr:NTP transferase domain-containing protein [uncultured Methanobrevibacter sp.]
MIIALIMAGGLSTRLKSNVEKPLFEFNKKHLIDYVLDNLKQSKLIDVTVVAVSHNTPNTQEYLKSKKFLKLEYNMDYDYNYYIESPGEGYLDDLSFLLDFFEKISSNNTIVVLNADLPFINSFIIDAIIEEYFKINKPALSVQIPVDVYKKYNISFSYEFNGFVPAGFNILKSVNRIQDQYELKRFDIEFAFNLNSLEDVDLAYKLLDINKY